MPDARSKWIDLIQFLRLEDLDEDGVELPHIPEDLPEPDVPLGIGLDAKDVEAAVRRLAERNELPQWLRTLLGKYQSADEDAEPQEVISAE